MDRSHATLAHKQLGAASIEVTMQGDKGLFVIENLLSGVKLKLSVAQTEALVANLPALLEITAKLGGAA